MRKPMIGISCNYDCTDIFGARSDAAAFNPKWHYISETYICSIEEAGGIPLLLPVFRSQADLETVLDTVDGVLVTGGNDVSPLEYHEVDRGKCGRIIPERDRQDIAIVDYIVHQTSKPMLCICRGTQILNVAMGGSLYQDLETDGPFFRHMKNNYPMNAVMHCVSVERDSLLFSILQKERLGVNSFHHQGIKTIGNGLRAVARSEDDVIEAIQLDGAAFILGVQWHPEKMYDSEEQKKLFTAFVENAAAHLQESSQRH